MSHPKEAKAPVEAAKEAKPKRKRTINPNANKSYSISMPPLRYEALKEYATQSNITISEVMVSLASQDANINAIYESKLEVYIADQIEALKASIRGQHVTPTKEVK